MLKYCKQHNRLDDYSPYFQKWDDEEMANIGFTLCRMCDKMISTYLKKLEDDFVKHGGIKERMYAARTGYRKAQDEHMKQLETNNLYLQAEIKRLQALLDQAGIKY